jgi:hypothetical protein
MNKLRFAVALVLLGLALAVDAQYQAFTTIQAFSSNLLFLMPDTWSLIIGNALGVLGLGLFSVSLRRIAQEEKS